MFPQPQPCACPTALLRISDAPPLSTLDLTHLRLSFCVHSKPVMCFSRCRLVEDAVVRLLSSHHSSQIRAQVGDLQAPSAPIGPLTLCILLSLSLEPLPTGLIGTRSCEVRRSPKGANACRTQALLQSDASWLMNTAQEGDTAIERRAKHTWYEEGRLDCARQDDSPSDSPFLV